nr:AAA family ATPase [Roseibium litorale]
MLLDGKAVRLRPKTLAVLLELHARQGDVVSQNDLRHAVWEQQHGRETGPKQCIRELRRLLDDTAERSKFIETVGRQGYRLVGELTLLNAGGNARDDAQLCVGRERELHKLDACAEAARRGKRTIAIVAGEAGSGKTRLIEAFCARLPRTLAFQMARGQCIPHPGAREPYGPLIEIVTQLADGSSRGPFLRLLEDVAPSWRDMIPALRAAGQPPAQSGSLIDARPDSMLREFTAFLERLSQRQPCLLVLEDLHWADQSTLAWLLSWAQRPGPAKVLVLGTYRFDELDKSGDFQTTLHYLQRLPRLELMTLEGLDQAAVADFLSRRFPGKKLPSVLCEELRQRTEGHAILVDAVVDHWRRDGAMEFEAGALSGKEHVETLAAAITRGTRSFISGEIRRLDSKERKVLEIASVAGSHFSAAMLSEDRREVEEIEAALDRLADVRRFIERAGAMTLPDGTEATRYVFRHALYQEALYESIPAANRQGVHERIGSRLEAAYKSRSDEISSTLADHFERAADWKRAAIYRGLSGLTALKRGAVADAAEQLRKALVSFEASDTDAEMRTLECRTLLGLGAALILSDHFTTAELRNVYERAAALSGKTNDPATIVPALAGLWNHHLTRADLKVAAELAQGLDDQIDGAPALHAMVAHNAVGQTRFFRGDLAACLPHIEAVCGAYDPGLGAEAMVLFGEDPGVVCHQYAACVHQLLGQDGLAERHFAEGLDLTTALDQPFGQAQMLWAGALIARKRGDPECVLERAQALIGICNAADIPFWRPSGDMLAGWAQVALGTPAGLEQLTAGLNAYEAMDVNLTRPFGLTLYAEAAGLCGDPSRGLQALASALKLIRQTGERWQEPEIYRLWATLAPQADRPRSAPLASRRAASLAENREGLAANFRS